MTVRVQNHRLLREYELDELETALVPLGSLDNSASRRKSFLSSHNFVLLVYFCTDAIERENVIKNRRVG